MFKFAISRLLLARSLTFGNKIPHWALDEWTRHMLDSQEVSKKNALGKSRSVSSELREEIHLDRFRNQAKLAKNTDYYARLFAKLKIQPDDIQSFSELRKFPITTKDALRENPDSFVNRKVHPFLRTMTTGTTGWPTYVHFSEYELNLISSLAAVDLHKRQLATEEDIVQISYITRATHINLGTGGAFTKVGAMVYQAGQLPAWQSLKLLSEKRSLAKRKPQTSVLLTYPSYFATLIETGLSKQYVPQDFGVELILLGGEMITEGLKRRGRKLFGDHIQYLESYALTELLPQGGIICSEGHLHFEDSHGLVEVLNPDTYAPVQDNEIGVIVATPYMPYRETTILLRYDTGDLVRKLPDSLNCSHKHLMGTSKILGKRGELKKQILTRDIQEILDDIDEIPLPTRYSIDVTEEKVNLKLLVKKDDNSLRHKIEKRLQESAINISSIDLIVDPSRLANPHPYRCDLRELTIRPHQDSELNEA